MSKLKNFDEFVNENLVIGGTYKHFGPGSLDPIIQKLIGEGKNESIIRTYLTSLGVESWRIDKAMSKFGGVEFSGEKNMNEAKTKKTFEETANKFLSDINEEDEESIDEASRWKGKEIFPNWVKPNELSGLIKKEKDLEKGSMYALLDLGLDVWQAEYEYEGKVGPIHIFKSTAQGTSDDSNIEFTDSELKSALKNLEIAVMEANQMTINEAKINKNAKRSVRPHNKVKPGMVAIDYNDEPYTVVGVGKASELLDFDDSGIAADEMDMDEPAIATIGRGGYAVYSYMPDGAVVYESEVNEARFVKDFNKDVLDATTQKEVKSIYPKAEFFTGKSNHFFGELDDNLFFKAYYIKGQTEFEIKSIYSQKGSNYVHLYLNESVVNEAKTKKTFEDAAAAFLLGLAGSDQIDEMSENKLPTNEEVTKCIADGMTYEQVCEKYPDADKAKLKEMYESCGKKHESVSEKLNKESLQIEEGDGEDIDDMIDDLADGDEDEYQGADDEAPKDKESDESDDSDSESGLDKAVKDAKKDKKKLDKIKDILTSEAEEVELDKDGKEEKDKENIEDEESGDEIEIEESVDKESDAYMAAVLEGLKKKFNG